MNEIHECPNCGDARVIFEGGFEDAQFYWFVSLHSYVYSLDLKNKISFCPFCGHQLPDVATIVEIQKHG